MPRRYRYHVLSHAHWDREWYQEFQGFRQRLVFQVDALLDLLDADPSYRCFHFDGQTSLVEDYLAIRPERRHDLARQLAAGRILMGPWFVMSDEFLASGESLVRNLLRGARICDAFGVAPTPIGYVTDNFGHCSQLPQMLRLIGLDAAILHNGTSGDRERTEMVWEGADGSEVLLVKIHVNSSYTDFDFYTRWDERLEDRPQYIRDKPKLATTHVLYGMDGADHAPVRLDLPTRMRMLAKESGWEVVHSTMAVYLRELFRAMGPRWQRGRIRLVGELRSPVKTGLWNYLHQGTGSSRLPLKQANDHVEWLLARAAEPLEAWSVLLGEAPQRAFLREAWRYALLNHPHDSIVGCSVDQAHRDMAYRFDQARCIAVNSLRESVQDLGDRIGTDVFGAGALTLTAINTGQYPTGPVTVVDIELPRSRAQARKPGHELVLVDRDRRRIHLQVLVHQPRMRSERFVCKRTESVASYVVNWKRGGHEPVERLTIAAPITVPGLGYRTWSIEEAPATPLPPLPASILGVTADRRTRTLENGALRVALRPDGTFDLHHKPSRRTYRRLHVLEDDGDAGDGWNFRSPQEDRRIRSTDQGAVRGRSITIHADGPLAARAVIRQSLRVPIDLLPAPAERHAGPKRRATALVDLGVETTLTLMAGLPRLEVRTRVQNTAKSHRLRAILPTGLHVARWHGDSPFDVVTRPVRLRDTTGWKEPIQEHHPIRNFIAGSDGRDGLAIITKGLCEACVQDKPGCPIALTLFRAFHEELWFERTTDSQLLGELVMDYAIVPFVTEGGELPLALFAQLEDYKSPRLFYCAQAHEGSLPAEGRLLALEGALTLTALKTSEDGRAVIVRLVNLHDTPQHGMLHARFRWRRAEYVDLLERGKGTALTPDEQGRIPLTLQRKEIVTLRLERA